MGHFGKGRILNHWSLLAFKVIFMVSLYGPMVKVSAQILPDLSHLMGGESCPIDRNREDDDSTAGQVEEIHPEIRQFLQAHPSVKLSAECFSLPDYNFGVLVHNEHFSIYRSACLGDMGVDQLKKHLQKNNMPMPRTVIYMNHYGYKKQEKSFGSLLRLISPGDYKLREFATKEDAALAKLGIEFYHPLSRDERDANVYLDGKNPAIPGEEPRSVDKILSEESKAYYNGKKVDFANRTLKGDRAAFYNILDIVLKRGQQPVLFHCKGGLHRTGIIALAIRYLQGGVWTKEFPTPLVVRPKVNPLFTKAVEIRNLAEYEYFLHNHRQFRTENLAAIRQLAADEEFQELKKAFGEKLSKDSVCQ